MGAGRPKSIDNTKVFDVARPGKSKPVSTSRPVIINHSMAVKDATVVSFTDEKQAQLTAPSASRKVINPITINTPESESVKPKSTITYIKEPEEQEVAVSTKASSLKPALVDETTADKSIAVTDKENEPTVPEEDTPPDASAEDAEPEVTDEAAEPTAPVVDEASTPDSGETAEETVVKASVADAEPEVTAAPPPEDFKPETEAAPTPEANTTNPENSEPASIDTVVESGDVQSTTQKEEADKLIRDVEVQKLIDSKKFIVPLAHDSTQSTSHKGAVIVLLTILLLLVSAYAAIDSGLVDVNIDLPYQFFK